jgi:prolyl-tRNA synthetase
MTTKVDVWFKTNLKNGGEVGLGLTHEEPMTRIAKENISSYRDLPFSMYQFQTKFRNETRAKSGIMRTREFIMKDLYSFSKNEEEHNSFYEKSKVAYTKIFKRLGLGHLTYITFASGGMFSKYSHEFQTISSVGEDVIYVDEEKGIAINKEVYNDEVIASLGLSKDTLVEKNAVEVGNIFTLGTRFSEPLDLTYQDENGEKNLVVMGSYGIGPGRVMGTIVEALSDEKGIIWPESVAPFSVHLLVLGEDENVRSEANSIYEKLVNSGVEVLFDDRSGVTAGEKFADSDLIGIPLRAVVSSRSIEAGGIEIKKRVDEKGSIVSSQELITQLTSKS